jgi:hypothetical protein
LLGLGSKRNVFLYDDSAEGNSFYDDEYCDDEEFGLKASNKTNKNKTHSKNSKNNNPNVIEMLKLQKNTYNLLEQQQLLDMKRYEEEKKRELLKEERAKNEFEHKKKEFELKEGQFNYNVQKETNLLKNNKNK